MDSPTSRSPQTNLSDVSWILWLGIPMASLLIVLTAPLMGYAAWDNYFMNGGMLVPSPDPAQDAANRWHSKEFGFLEVTPLLFLAGAVALGVTLFIRRRQLPRHVGAFMLLVGVAAFYFMGEESSWGQHYLGYKTPSALQTLNRQHEFNLHNNRGTWKTIFSTIPRTAATVVVAAAAVAPFFLRRAGRLQDTDRAWYWLLPTPAMSLICGMAALSTLPAHVIKYFLRIELSHQSYLYMAIEKPSGEFKEYLIALAMLVYLASAFTRLRCRNTRRALQSSEAAASESDEPAGPALPAFRMADRREKVS